MTVSRPQACTKVRGFVNPALLNWLHICIPSAGPESQAPAPASCPSWSRTYELISSETRPHALRAGHAYLKFNIILIWLLMTVKNFPIFKQNFLSWAS